MFTPVEGKMLDVDLDTLLGPRGSRHTEVRDQVARVMDREDLHVRVIVLCHGDDRSRFATTGRLCRALAPAVTHPRIQLMVSYQDGPVPAGLTTQLGGAVAVLSDHPALTEPSGAAVARTGKTEHLLGCLAALARQGGDPRRQFVIFLDNDYLVYDLVSLEALYLPWVLGFAQAGSSPADPRFAHVTFAKGGSLRLAVSPHLTLGARARTCGFADLLDAALAHAAPWVKPITERVPAGFIPTRTALIGILGAGVFADVETAVEQVTKHGGRSSRALSLWLASRREHVVEAALSRFSFLLHGDQGATLAAWSAMELAPGYGLEISFLLNALFRPDLHTGRIVNCLGLPHAHLPKAEADNFALGVEMFTLLEQLLHGMTSRAPHPGHAATARAAAAEPWQHHAATKLGYKRVQLSSAPQRVPALYPPLSALTGATP
ncbi:hypothetical protein [Amycolatopsis magusensis]|uniref:hypothetical protein n=1 Tax=Amycolatopsis magusensis TaxID=882444 RepID=UPI0037A653AD